MLVSGLSAGWMPARRVEPQVSHTGWRSISRTWPWMHCNGVRTAAAAALVDWLATDPTVSGSGDFLILGDLNAYSQEDPITTIESAGYDDLIEAFGGTGVADGVYSFNFFSESASLDHALSTPDMTAHVTVAAIWHINSDEPRALDYNNEFNQPLLYSPDEFRSSDHDPLVVGLYADSDGDGVLDVVDAHPNSDLSPTVVVNGCDSGVANDVLPSGSSIADLVNDAFDAGGKRGHKLSARCASWTATWCRPIPIAKGTLRVAISGSRSKSSPATKYSANARVESPINSLIRPTRT